MAFPRNSLRAFLSHARTSLQQALRDSPCKEKLTFVIGNESADLDSLTSSLLYAYFRSLAPPQGAFSSLYIPILNIPRDDIRLRPEFLTLFKYANIKSEHITTLDDLPSQSILEQKLPPSLTSWVLVDHNSLQHELGSNYRERVHGVIDHHEEENSVRKDTDPEPRVIEKAGSCTSLVIRTFQDDWQGISGLSMTSGAAHAQGDSLANDSHLSNLWDSQAAKLAMGSILIDTSNLKSEHKTTSIDMEMVKYLESKINLQDAMWDRKAFYQELNTAKKAIDDFAVKDILRKDWKWWTERGGKTLGIASVVKPLDFLTQKAAKERKSEDGLESIIQEIMDDKKLTVFAIMTNSKASGGGRKRELLLQTHSNDAKIRKRFDDSFGKTLQLELLVLPWVRQDENTSRNIWIQGDISKSRKQVAPLLRQAVNEA